MAASSSSVPVWVTLGFAGGLVFAFAFLKSAPAPEEPKPVQVKPAPAPVAGAVLRQIPNLPRDASTLGEVEALFQAWGGYAIWKYNATQFALWNRETDAHTDFYEARRVSRIYYFRTLPEKDWPLIDHGEMVRCPLWFAETPEMREKFYHEHPEKVPGLPILRSLPPRSPLLPPLPPVLEETGTTTPATPPPETGRYSAPPPQTVRPALTPGAGE